MSEIFEKLKGNILNSYTYSVGQFIENIRDLNITKISIHRVPLQASSLLLLNLISLGEFNKRLSQTLHDKLFHLYAIVELSNGLIYILD